MAAAADVAALCVLVLAGRRERLKEERLALGRCKWVVRFDLATPSMSDE